VPSRHNPPRTEALARTQRTCPVSLRLDTPSHTHLLCPR